MVVIVVVLLLLMLDCAPVLVVDVVCEIAICVGVVVGGVVVRALSSGLPPRLLVDVVVVW